MNRRVKRTCAILMSLLLIAVMTVGVSADKKNKKDKNPYAQPDDTWISISGTVEDVESDRFQLDYGEGEVTVEFDDGDRDGDAYKLLKGDKVTVNGVIDDDFLEKTKIEASSVYLEKLGTTFYASAIDEEDAAWIVVSTPVIVSMTVLEGTVTKVQDEEFLVRAGGETIRVEVDEMPYNPLDDEGYQKIRKGDRVRVTGEIDYDLFEGSEFVADSVITLKKAKRDRDA